MRGRHTLPDIGFSHSDKSRNFHCTGLTVCTVVNHGTHNPSGEFQHYGVNTNEDFEVKVSGVGQRELRGNKQVLCHTVPPGFNGLIRNLKCGHFRAKGRWSRKSGNTAVKSGGTSLRRHNTRMSILTWPFQRDVPHVCLVLTNRNLLNV